MAELDGLVDDLLSALETPGAIDSWLERCVVDGDNDQHLSQVFLLATRRLLGDAPANTAGWEHLLFASASRSAKSNQELLCDACRAAINELTQMVQDDQLSSTAAEQIVTLASALTIVLSAQRRLRQPVEIATSALHETFPEYVPEMAERCQDIWQRHGQMSGLVGLYLWDARRNEWRLNQDFKPHRPT